MSRSEQFWHDRLAGLQDPSNPWRVEAKAIASRAQYRRDAAKFNTGTISETAAVALRSIAHWAGAKTVIEVGTFIGNSTLALKAVATQVYTCDFSNNCFETHEGIETFPHRTSLQMLSALQARNVRADLCFFDGRLGTVDARVLMDITTPDCVYVFDDYSGQEKGWCNVQLLTPYLPGHVLITPEGLAKDDTTLALLVPEDRL